MPYLKKITKNSQDYYYIYHTVRDGKKFRKISKYVGKKKPSALELKRLKEEFAGNLKRPVKGNLVSMLQDIQDRFGYLPEKELERLSMDKGIPGTDIFGVASFYSQFRLKKPAKYTISVCTGTACHVKNSGGLIGFIKQHLGINIGETTKNGLIRLETVNCIGACAKAPAVMINNKVYGKMDNAKLSALLSELK